MRRFSGRPRTTTSSTSRSAASRVARRGSPASCRSAVAPQRLGAPPRSVERGGAPAVSIHPQVRIVVKPYGSALPLGFFSYVGGWVALAIFVVAMYGGLAFLLEDAHGRTDLPLLRRGKSREAAEGSLEEQLQSLAEEAGVRHTL